MASNECLNELLNKLNKGTQFKNSILVHLSNDVDYVKICEKKHLELKALTKKNINSQSMILDSYYLVKKNGLYVGLVYDMVGDLHFFVKRKFRGACDFSYHLNKTIFPHIFTKRDKQDMSFINEKVATHYFKHVPGLVRTGPLDAELPATASTRYDLAKSYRLFTEEEFALFKKRKHIADNAPFRLYDSVKAKNPKATWVLNETTISLSDWDMFSEDEKVNFTKEDFLTVMAKHNYYNNLNKFCREQLELLYGEERGFHLHNYLFDADLKELSIEGLDTI